jgi:hypothetical protein
VERGLGGGVSSSEDARHCSVLYICKYFVVQPDQFELEDGLNYNMQGGGLDYPSSHMGEAEFAPPTPGSEYAPSQAGYASSQAGYAPSQAGAYASSQAGYASSQAGYGSSQVGYASSQQGYAPPAPASGPAAARSQQSIAASQISSRKEFAL